MPADRPSQEIAVRACTEDDWAPFFAASAAAFSREPSAEERDAQAGLIAPERLLVAEDAGAIVGTAGAYPFEVTIPGGRALPASGVTYVGVLASHRRRGILGALMRRQLADARARGEGLAVLWATEGAIYARFGYGVGTWRASVEVDRARARFLGDPAPLGQARLVGADEAARLFPAVYERFRAGVPGALRRSPLWWERRRLADPEWLRRGGGPMLRAVLEIDGRPEGYALYRVNRDWSDPHGFTGGALEVVEAVGTAAAATREVWRYLFGVDLPQRVRAGGLDPEHPLRWLLSDPRQVRTTVADGLWVRLVDVQIALGARAYAAEGSIVLALADEACPWNDGTWRLDTGREGAAIARVTFGEPDLRLAATDLGALYLGGTAARTLLRAGRIEEVRPGGVARLDALFRTERAPWFGDGF